MAVAYYFSGIESQNRPSLASLRGRGQGIKSLATDNSDQHRNTVFYKGKKGIRKFNIIGNWSPRSKLTTDHSKTRSLAPIEIL